MIKTTALNPVRLHRPCTPWVLLVVVCILGLPMWAVDTRAQDLDEITVFEMLDGSEDILLMAGTINSDTPAQLAAVLNANPGVQTILLTDCRGSSDDEVMFPMARGVRARGLNTHVTSTSDIASGCVDFFLAGNRRTMEPGAKFGVHSWADDDKSAKDYPRDSGEHQLNRKYIEDMLGSDAFYWFTIYAAPAEGMHYMTMEEIARYQLLTQ